MPIEREPAAIGRGIGRAEIDPGATAIAVAAPLGRASDLIAAWHGRPVAAWQGRDGDAFVGLDVAASISINADSRQHAGDERRSRTERLHPDPARAARIVARGGEILARVRGASIDGIAALAGDLVELGIQPRMLGGFAFVRGSAAAGAWRAFGDAWWFLPRLTYVRRDDRAWLVAIADPRSAYSPAALHADLARARDALARPRSITPLQAIRIDDGDRDGWLARVTSATSRIAAGTFDKVVLARAIDLAASADFDVPAIVETLDERHPECTRFVFRPGYSCAFVGASPERLIARRGSAIASEGLAGSLPRALDPAALLASTKDRGEHAIVVDAIAHTLAPYCDALDVPTTPAIRSLRHVHHLRTTVTGRLRAPTHVLELAAALHPTPAVGGWPTGAALDHLAHHEREPRGWYAAPVGWFDAAGDGELTVAIRSALVDGPRARAFAGAGIVADSEPAAEWDETRIKLRAMCGALGRGDDLSARPDLDDDTSGDAGDRDVGRHRPPDVGARRDIGDDRGGGGDRVGHRDGVRGGGDRVGDGAGRGVDIGDGDAIGHRTGDGDRVGDGVGRGVGSGDGDRIGHRDGVGDGVRNGDRAGGARVTIGRGS